MKGLEKHPSTTSLPAAWQWQPEEFFRGGEINVENEILADLERLGPNQKPHEMRVLELGCGAGRMTKAMAAVFAEVDGVDISGEMIALAKRNLADVPNVSLYKNNGSDLAGLADSTYDLAFSYIVFQHIPMPEVIENYVREVHRCLKPGAVFKFQVQGDTSIVRLPGETWVGAPLSLGDAQSLARRCGFDLIHATGPGTQYFWLWFLKPRWRWIPWPIRNRCRVALARARAAVGRIIDVGFEPDRVEAGRSCGSGAWFCQSGDRHRL